MHLFLLQRGEQPIHFARHQQLKQLFSAIRWYGNPARGYNLPLLPAAAAVPSTSTAAATATLSPAALAAVAPTQPGSARPSLDSNATESGGSDSGRRRRLMAAGAFERSGSERFRAWSLSSCSAGSAAAAAAATGCLATSAVQAVVDMAARQEGSSAVVVGTTSRLARVSQPVEVLLPPVAVPSGSAAAGVSSAHGPATAVAGTGSASGSPHMSDQTPDSGKSMAAANLSLICLDAAAAHHP